MADVTELPVEEVLEVMEYLDAEAEIEAFKVRNAKIIQEYTALCEQRNTTLEAADKAVRARGVSCGPFKQLTPQTKIFPEQLYNAVGRDEFRKLGGVIGTTSTYEIDKRVLEAAIARKAIPEEVIPLVKQVTPKYSNIPKAVLP